MLMDRPWCCRCAVVVVVLLDLCAAGMNRTNLVVPRKRRTASVLPSTTYRTQSIGRDQKKGKVGDFGQQASLPRLPDVRLHHLHPFLTTTEERNKEGKKQGSKRQRQTTSVNVSDGRPRPSLTMEGSDKQSNHNHKTRKAGRGAKEKKKDRKAKKDHTRVERHNHRAFSVANIVRTQRSIQRNLDKAQQKEYVPQKDRRSADQTESPPSVVVVMGPTGVGKVSLSLAGTKAKGQTNNTVRQTWTDQSFSLCWYKF